MGKRGPPPIKGRGLDTSKVLAVRINKDLYDDFIAFCNKNNLDKASVVEEALLQWLSQHLGEKESKVVSVRLPLELKITTDLMENLEVEIPEIKLEYPVIKLDIDGLVRRHKGSPP